MKKNIALMALTGILTLASCGQNGTPDTTGPTLTFTASPSTNVSGGATVTLSGTVTDTTGVKSVVITSSNGGPVCTPTITGSNFSCTVTMPSPTAATTYNYTATATDTVSTPNTSTATASVQVNGTTVTPPPGGGDSTVVINVTSPVNGAVVDPASTPVAFTISGGTLTGVKCTVDGKDVNATVTGNAGVCTVDLTGKTGSVAIKVSGTDTSGKTAIGGTNVTIKATNNTQPVSPFKTDQQIVPDASGKVNYDDPKFVNGAWRILPQQVDGTSFTPVIYVRDVVGIDTTLPSGATREEIWVSNSSDGLARLYLYDSQVNGTNAANVTLDSNLLDQGVMLYIVKRVYTASGSTTTSYPFIVDNSPTQAADPAISKGAAPSNLITNLGGVRDNNWAKGTINIYTTNTDLSDKLGPLPSGTDKITYYFVPASSNNLITALPYSADPNSTAFQSRIANIKKYATKTRVSEDKSGTGQWTTTYDSVAEKDAEGQAYYIYAVTTDQIGNEMESSIFQKVAFDNVGPNSASAIKDISDLPFASCDVNKYISDWFAISGRITDGGVGFGQTSTNAYLSIGTITVPLSVSAGGILQGGGTYDSNSISDGTYTLTSNLTDLLGNTATHTGPTVVVDNTDPAVNWISPAPGQLITSGDNVQVTTNIDQDSGAPIDTTRTRLFWNDYLPGAYASGQGGYPTEGPSTRTRTNGYVGAPVEFANGKTTISSRGSRATWTALSPNSTQNDANHNMNLVQLAVDCAGNASITNRTVNINPNTKIKPAPLTTQPGLPNTLDGLWNDANLPTFGRWDVYANNRTAIYNTPTQVLLHRYQGTDGLFDISNANSATNPSGLFTADIAVGGTSSRAGSGANIDQVNYHRQLDLASWEQIVAWQTGKDLYGNPVPVRAGADNYAYYPDGVRVDPTLYHNSGFTSETAAQSSTLASERGVYWLGQVDLQPVAGTDFGGSRYTQPHAAPWFNMNPTATSNAFYRLTANYKNQEHGASAVGAVATDTLGLYSYTADYELSFTARNTTPAAILAAAYTAPTSIPLDFTLGSWENLTANAINNGYVLQGLVPGTTDTYVDIVGGHNSVTWTPPSVVAGSSHVSASYNVNAGTPAPERYTKFRLRLGDRPVGNSDDTYFSDTFSLNITY